MSIDPAELLFTGTLAGARALDMEERFGNLDVGKDADFLLIDPGPLGAARDSLLGATASARTTTQVATDQELFALLMGLREPAIVGTFVQGRRAVAPEREAAEDLS